MIPAKINERGRSIEIERYYKEEIKQKSIIGSEKRESKESHKYKKKLDSERNSSIQTKKRQIETQNFTSINSNFQSNSNNSKKGIKHANHKARRSVDLVCDNCVNKNLINLNIERSREIQKNDLDYRINIDKFLKREKAKKDKEEFEKKTKIQKDFRISKPINFREKKLRICG